MTKKKRPSRTHRPDDHRRDDIYIDTEQLIADHVASREEIDLVTLFFSHLVEYSITGDLCEPCGKKIIARIGATPGIVEAGLQIVIASAPVAGIDMWLYGINDDYDFFEPEHRKSALCDLAEFWSDVVAKMRTCGPTCPACNAAGPDWRTAMRGH